MHKIEIIDPTKYPGWDEMVLSTPDHSFFHSSFWARTLTGSYGYKPIYFTVLARNRLLGLIPLMAINSNWTGHRGVSLPFSDYCEPLFPEPSFFPDLFNAIVEFGKKFGWKYVELRGGERFFPNIVSSSSYYLHTLDLSANESDIFSGFKDSTRRNIRKAVREGVQVRIGNSLHFVEEFYRLHCMTRKIHGLPPQPFYFFRNICDHILSGGHGMLALAYFEKKIIAGAVYFHFGKKAIYKYGASDKAYQHLRPNDLVMWEAIRFYCGKKYTNFSMGRTEKMNKGLQGFKIGWNTTERAVNYYRYHLGEAKFVADSDHSTFSYRTLLSHAPITLLRIMGFLAYKHMG